MTGFATPPSDTGVIRASPCESPCAPSAAPWILAATILASSMAFIDGTVVNVALPALQQQLNASLVDVQWVIEAYALFLAALLLVGGAAGDRFGRRRVFLLGVALFAISSLGCGLAGSVRELVLARALQGIGGALLVPGSLAIISASFAEHDRGKAIGTWSGATAITAALGPVLGGWLIDHVSWRAVFFINLPLAAAVIAIALRHVPESRNAEVQGKLDWLGALLVTLGLGGVVYGLIESSNADWSQTRILASLLLGVVALAAFIAVEIRQEAPMMPTRLFRSRTFTGANLLTFLLYGALGGSLFFVPLNLIQVQGYSTTAAGAAMLPLILLLSIAVAVVGRPGRPFRREGAAGHRPGDRGRRLRDVCRSRHRRKLLDHILPGNRGTRPRHVDQRCPADDDGDELRRRRFFRRCIGHQQRCIARRFPALSCLVRADHDFDVRPRPARPTRAGGGGAPGDRGG